MMATTSSGKTEVTLPTESQILIRREFDAPRLLVYRAYTEPDLISRWRSGERGGSRVSRSTSAWADAGAT